MDALAEQFRTTLRGPLPPAALGASSLERLLPRWYEAGRAAWPTVALPVEDFVHHLADRISAWPTRSQRSLGRLLHPEDLYLTGACAAGVPEAQRCLEGALLPRVLPVLASLMLPASTAEDLALRVLRELVVPADAAPAVAAYDGRESLVGWALRRLCRAALRAVPPPPLVHAWRAAGRSAWPGIEVSSEDLARSLADRLASWPGAALLDLVRVLRPEDLYLACACARGAAGALYALERALFPLVAARVVRLGLGEDDLREVVQRLRTRLLAGAAAEPPSLAAYPGHGSLEGWLLRIACDEARRHATRRRPERLASGGGGEVFDVLRELPGIRRLLDDERRVGEVKEAFQGGFQDLTTEQRVILRMSLLNGSTPAEIGLVDVRHRIPIRRRLEQAHEDLRRRARARLERRPDPPAAQRDGLEEEDDRGEEG